MKLSVEGQIVAYDFIGLAWRFLQEVLLALRGFCEV